VPRCVLETKQSTRRGGPALQKSANKIVLCWSVMTDTERHGYTRERERGANRSATRILLKVGLEKWRKKFDDILMTYFW